jgi:hypothetical protein
MANEAIGVFLPRHHSTTFIGKFSFLFLRKKCFHKNVRLGVCKKIDFFWGGGDFKPTGEKWLIIFTFFQVYMIFMAKISQTKKPQLSITPVSWNMFPQIYVLYLKTGYTLGAHCKCKCRKRPQKHRTCTHMYMYCTSKWKLSLHRSEIGFWFR